MNAFKRNLLIGYSISLLLLILSAVASYFSISNLLNSQRWVNHTNEVLNKLESVVSSMKEAESAQRGYLLTDNTDFLKPYRDASNESLQLIGETKTLTSDNASQQVNADLLRITVSRRLKHLDSLIQLSNNGIEIRDSLLLSGKSIMDSALEIVKNMQDEEKILLEQRTSTMKDFAASTPTFIILASLLAIIVTVISYFRVNSDFEKRQQQQRELEKRNKEIAENIRIIERISSKIATGDYSVRVAENEKENLGVLAISLDKMAGDLESSFISIDAKEWLQAGIATLNGELVGEKDIASLSNNVISLVAEYSSSQAGAFYIITEKGDLMLQNSYSLATNKLKPVLKLGEGLAGQAASSEKMLEVSGLTAENYTLSFVAGELKPKTIIAFPIFFNNRVKGVIELASMEDYSDNVKRYFEAVAYNTGIAINTAQNKEKVQQLLEEMQAQTEELQTQHSELENVNAELETQAEKLQASEEELRVQQEELQQANQELEERSRMLEEKNELILERNLDIQRKAEELTLSTKYKSEFLANMSHELRTPLNSILLLSRLLSENHQSNLSKEQIEYADVIQSSGKGLLTLIDEILDLSKIESGKMELEFADVHHEEIARELRLLFEPVAKEKGLAFTVELTKDLPGMIETDRLRLEQILRNLISNALKFTKKGSVTLTVTNNDDMFSFAVKDTGIGIAKEKQQTIFEAFQQADGSTRRQFGGTGLGLSISRELARLLGGEIRLYSEEGKGSQFILLLPSHIKTQASLPQTEITEEEVVPAKHNGSSGDKKFISKTIPSSIPDDRNAIKKGDKTILIIEDDIGFAKSLLDYTRNKGYKGIVAVRGDEGVELAKQFMPTGILLDLQLPVKSGWEVMEELKSDNLTRPIPVHIMSSQEAKTKSISKGAVDFIDKPVAFEKLGEMFSRIEEALSRHPKKVLIIEENPKHAKALAYFLESYQVNSEIRNSVGDGIKALNRDEVDCVILDMGIPAQVSYDVLEDVKKTPGFENLPIIVFTGENLSHVEEMKIKQYADSIVVKTAHSYQRILDEVSLFLHLMEESKKEGRTSRYKKLGELGEVLKGKTVLVADDDVRNIFSLTKSLENYGMNIISAIDGKEALKQLSENPKVDLVLMDMMMPEMDGYESTRRIREIPKYRNLPVIAVTAKAMTGDREKCIAAGASDYITKPVDVDQLISLLRVWLYE